MAINTAIIEMNLVLYLHSYDYTTLIWKKVIKVFSCCIICNLTIKPMPNFWVGDRVKDKITKLRFRCQCQPPGLSKCNKICDVDTARRRGEELIFKPKFPIIYTKDFIYINSSLWKINQGLNLEKMPVFVGFSHFFWRKEGGGGWILM